MELLAIVFLLIFVAWLLSPPRRGGHRPPEPMTVDQVCECQSLSSCRLQVAIPFDEAMAIKRRGAIIIVDGCARGPEPTDTLLERCDGYSLYRET